MIDFRDNMSNKIKLFKNICSTKCFHAPVLLAVFLVTFRGFGVEVVILGFLVLVSFWILEPIKGVFMILSSIDLLRGAWVILCSFKLILKLSVPLLVLCPASSTLSSSLAASRLLLIELCKRLIGEVVQSRRRPLLGPFPGWKRPLALSHLRHYANRALTHGK